MEITTEQYDKISHFLDAEMTLAEMEAFENELLANPAMRKQLDFEQLLRDGFATQGIKINKEQSNIGGIKKVSIPLNNNIAANNNQVAAKTTVDNKKINTRKWISIAIAASLIVAIIVLVINNKRHTEPTITQLNNVPYLQKKDTITVAKTPEKIDTIKSLNIASIYKKYFVRDKLPEEYPMLLADALNNYDDGNYKTIQQLSLADVGTRTINEIDSKQNILELGHYYKGIAFLETNNAQQAITNLEWIIANSTSKTIKAKAEWYLALAYIKLNKIDSAVKTLKNLTNNSKAKKLLVELQH